MIEKIAYCIVRRRGYVEGGGQTTSSESRKDCLMRQARRVLESDYTPVRE